MEFNHISVLLTETLDMLDCQIGDVVVDGTLGGGGHSEEILKRIGPEGKLIGIDRDIEALQAARERLNRFGDNVEFVHGNFVNVKQIINDLGINSVDGMIMDLGVSSYQLTEADRGFTYNENAPLDMRMDQNQEFSAYDVVNFYPQDKLLKIIRDYGEERWTKRISQFIVDNRPIESTGELVDVIKMAIPAAARRTGPHPAKRTFQAIRIEVNGELTILEEAVKNAVDILKPGGRLCIITFHSLEDRIVKQTFLKLKNPCICPPKSPICTCGKQPIIDILTKKPIYPNQDELEYNPRSRSAKLRACQKL